MSKTKLFVAVFVITMIVLPGFVFAQEGLAPTGFESVCGPKASGGLAGCISRIYLLSLGLGAIFAVLMITLAGYKYMTAQGNSQQVEDAKKSFAAAFIGFIVLFIAFILLNAINPDLVRFRNFANLTDSLPIPVTPIKDGPVSVTLTPDPQIIKPGESSEIFWESVNANRCIWEEGFSGVAFPKGRKSTGALTENTNYSIRCFNDFNETPTKEATGGNTVVVRNEE